MINKLPGTAPSGGFVHTVVSFHAHPDDEVLLTGGTLARAAADGHRVVVVFATDGGAGLTDPASHSGLAHQRRAEARAAARELGVARVEFLGYADSGDDGGAPAPAFARAEVADAAERLAEILRAEGADVLTVYDAHGGYGHPDHRQVHVVGVAAASLAGTPAVLEATVDRTALWRAARFAQHLPGVPADFGAARLRDGFAARADITHRIDVRSVAARKRAAMAAHASQARGGADARTLAVFLRLPMPLFRAVFGHEWFIERGRTPGGAPLRDLFDTVTPNPSRPVPAGTAA